MTENNIYTILEICQGFHNSKMAGYKHTPEDLKNIRERILDVLCDTKQLCDCMDEIDGCCFEIMQGNDTTEKHWLEETDAIDKAITTIRYIIDGDY